MLVDYVYVLDIQHLPKCTKVWSFVLHYSILENYHLLCLIIGSISFVLGSLQKHKTLENSLYSFSFKSVLSHHFYLNDLSLQNSVEVFLHIKMI